ncbi:Fur family transcriptional regulator [Bacillus salipaludis]|uniref:Fur family transcriptional regulator n=1 Tax=Bacillus salipaludis TaxID=2547811 RepID=A0AA90Z5F8_9BACI|nr:Fur family transcriptional regulator [Bacillus salipaludis]MDQ6600922.1 Fur family transcriptional regulator [Bacillus salipaludis]
MNTKGALQLLKAKGYKYTGQRELLIHCIYDEKRYVSAKEVLGVMQKEYPNLSFDTIYRNLSLFEELGILETTEFKGERLFRFACSDEHHHHHHIICIKCRRTISFVECPMKNIFNVPKGFEITGHKFEIYGYCKDCA